MKYDDFKQELVFDFEKKEEQKYIFNLLPGALKDFYEKENDTLNYKLATKNYTDYGNLRLRWGWAPTRCRRTAGRGRRSPPSPSTQRRHR